MRFFNTEGPVNCADHYCLPPLARLDLEAILPNLEGFPINMYLPDVFFAISDFIRVLCIRQPQSL